MLLWVTSRPGCSENRVTALPVELRALRKLHTLNLANNELQARKARVVASKAQRVYVHPLFLPRLYRASQHGWASCPHSLASL